MWNRKELSLEDRTKIIFFRQNTVMSMRAIGDSVGCSVSCVKKTLDRYRETNSVEDRPRSGRPNAMTEKDRLWRNVTVLKQFLFFKKNLIVGERK